MASYLVDLILLAALLFTSIRVTKMHRELVHLRTCQGDFGSVLGKTTETVDDMVLMVREFSADGKQLVNTLGDKIEEARKAIMDIEARGDALRGRAQAAANRADDDEKELALSSSFALAHRLANGGDPARLPA
jgi:hypothetical protein